ncbi:MAG: bile acid:sodium symporter family protein [Planctomycetales bacterium]|nr:bile acid:sodium symporter family protein [Planctomycetales bacterium]
MRDFFRRRWFLIFLVVSLTAGFGMPKPLEPVASAVPRSAVAATVLFLMALPLDASAIWNSVRRPQGVLLAVAICYGLLPLVAWGIAQALPNELAVGLMIAATVPSTLASAAVWTRHAGGNDVICLQVTSITYLMCTVVMPWWLVLTTGQSVEIDAGEMVTKLAMLVVLPTLAGQFMRIIPLVAQWASRNKSLLSTVAQVGILAIVFVGSVTGGIQIRAGQAVHPLVWLEVTVAIVVLHVSMLAAGHVFGRLVGLSRADRIAVGFSGSQKTLMIGLLVAVEFYSELALAMLPMIIYHVFQLLFDTLVADRFRQRQQAAEAN